MVSARLAEMIVRDEQDVVPVGAYAEQFGVTLSLPTVLSRQGAREMLHPPLSPEEEQALQRSAATLRKAGERIGIAA